MNVYDIRGRNPTTGGYRSRYYANKALNILNETLEAKYNNYSYGIIKEHGEFFIVEHSKVVEKLTRMRNRKEI